MTRPIASPPSAEVPFNRDFQRNYTAQRHRRRGDRGVRERVRPRQQNRVARFRVMGNRTELENEIAGFQRRLATYLGVFGVGMIAINAAAILLGLQPLRRVRRALALVREGNAQAARRPLPGRDRAARQRDQCADRKQQAHRRALAHAGRQPRAFAEDAAGGDAQRRPRAGRRQGPADRRPGVGHADAGRALPAARPRRRAARQRRLSHAGRRHA